MAFDTSLHRVLDEVRVEEVGRLRSMDRAPGVVLFDPSGEAWAPASD